MVSCKKIDFLNNIIITYLLIFLLIFSTVTIGLITEMISADSNNYYVSITGNNSNNGLSPETAWRTIEYAVTKVISGDTVNIMTGIYTPTTQILIQNKNTASSWLTIQNYNDDLVIIEGDNCPKIATSGINATIEIRDSKYIRITGLIINHSAMCGISLRKIGSINTAFVKIDNCSITNCSAAAIKVQGNGQNNITLEYNYIYNNFNNWSIGPPYSTQETLSFEHVNNFSINHNIIKNNCAENIDMKGGCKYGSICYNTINTTGGRLVKLGQTYYGGPAIMLDARGVSSNISIYNNNIFGNASGISLNTETTGHYEYIYVYNNMINMTKKGAVTSVTFPQPLFLSNLGRSTDLFHHIYIYSNTVHTGSTNNYPTFQIGHYSINQLNSSNLQNVYLVNNIFVTDYPGSSSAFTASFLSPDDGVVIFNNNTYYRSSGTLKCRWDGADHTELTEYYWGDNPLFTDPKFINRADQFGDFHLNNNSPCIDVGNRTLVPSFDFDNIYRPQGAGYDIGAFEFSFLVDTTPPQISTISIVTSNPLDTDPLYGWINISCDVTDNVAVSQVLLRIHNPGGSWNNISMTNGPADNYYYQTTSAFSNAGNYSYSILAKDTSNNVKTSNSILFSMPPNWDINNDGSCTILDLVLISNQYGLTGSKGWIREDVDNNGEVTILDMILISNHYGENWYT